jgi:hypothetical protein
MSKFKLFVNDSMSNISELNGLVQIECTSTLSDFSRTEEEEEDVLFNFSLNIS